MSNLRLMKNELGHRVQTGAKVIYGRGQQEKIQSVCGKEIPEGLKERTQTAQEPMHHFH